MPAVFDDDQGEQQDPELAWRSAWEFRTVSCFDCGKPVRSLLYYRDDTINRTPKGARVLAVKCNACEVFNAIPAIPVGAWPDRPRRDGMRVVR